MMIDLAEKDLNIKIRKKMLSRAVDNYRAKRQKSVDYTYRLFGISRQGLYKRKDAEQRKLAQARDVVDCVRQIRRIMPRLGGRKLHHLLTDDCPIGPDKLFTILKSNQLLVKPRRSYRITTNSKHMFRRHKNLIADLPILHPEQVWVSDITYIGNHGHNHYLALVTDAYSKKIVGYDLSQSLAAEGAVRALKMALKTRRTSAELIHHSDRGIQYCCDAYQRVLEKAKVTVSMTQNGDPLENAIAERVNGILKEEFMLEKNAGKHKPVKENNRTDGYYLQHPATALLLRIANAGAHAQAGQKTQSYIPQKN